MVFDDDDDGSIVFFEQLIMVIMYGISKKTNTVQRNHLEKKRKKGPLFINNK
jgi:hypothetical protein